jgi:hypothetical protein
MEPEGLLPCSQQAITERAGVAITLFTKCSEGVHFESRTGYPVSLPRLLLVLWSPSRLMPE